MEMTDTESEDMPAGAGAPLSAPDGQVFLQEVQGERPLLHRLSMRRLVVARDACLPLDAANFEFGK